jgi:23S rRNA pseudouridine2605 synthase
VTDKPRTGKPRAREGRRVGLARALSKLGYSSRSQAGEMIREGRVRLNGTVRRDAEYPVRIGRDRLEVDGASVAAENKIYLMLNKPRGIVTSASDEKGRDTIYALIPEHDKWIAPVGRLDKASEGLLLLTNDSEWGARLAAPETHLDKTYHVQISGSIDDKALEILRRGVRDSGDLLRAKSVEVLREGEHNMWLIFVLEEGKNRQIRRMLTQVGAEVLRLVRVSIGPLQLGDLAKGATRKLAATEKSALDRAMRFAQVGAR